MDHGITPDGWITRKTKTQNPGPQKLSFLRIPSATMFTSATHPTTTLPSSILFAEEMRTPTGPGWRPKSA